MGQTFLSNKPRVFYGYWIVTATFFFNFINSGCGSFTFSIFVKPLQADLSWSRGEIMTAFTIYSLFTGLTLPLVGKLVDRYGARKVIFVGALIGGLGFLSLSLMNSFLQFYASYAIIGIGMSAIGYVPASAIVSNWFQKRRGLALGIMSMGIGVGGLTLAPFIGAYLIPNLGWRATYLFLGVIAWAIVIPLALLVIREKPADLGLIPYNTNATEAFTTNKATCLISKELTLKMALATPAFWLITISYTLSAFSLTGAIQSQVPFLQDIGIPAAMAAIILGVIGLMSAISKFGFGWLCDRIPADYACSIGLGFQLIGIALLLNIETASPSAIIWLSAISLGLGAGSWLPTMSILTSTNFGLASYGAIFGTAALVQSIGVATGPLMAGYLYDAINTYHRPFMIFLILYAISIPSVLAVRHAKTT